jgi:WD40 repeat protein
VPPDGFEVTNIALSPDGAQALVAFSAGRQVEGGSFSLLTLYDTKAGRQRVDLCDKPVTGLRWLSGRQALVSRESLPVAVWNTAKGEPVRDLDVGDPSAGISIVAVSADGRLAVAASNGRIWIMDVATGRSLRRFQSLSPGGAAFSRDGARLLLGSALWDVGTGRKLHTYGNEHQWLTAARFSPDGRTALVIIGHPDPRARGVGLIDIATGKVAWQASCGMYDGAFSPDGKEVAAAAIGKGVFVGRSDLELVRWETATGRELLHVKAAKDGVVACAFSADARRCLVAVSRGGLLEGAFGPPLVQLWDGTTGRLLRQWDAAPEREQAAGEMLRRFGPSQYASQ